MSKFFIDMNKECEDLNYEEAIQFIFDRENLLNMKLNGCFCNKCGLRQYHGLKYCSCGGEFKDEITSVSILYVRLNKSDRRELLIKKLRENIYLEISNMLEKKYRDYYNDYKNYCKVVNYKVYQILREYYK